MPTRIRLLPPLALAVLVTLGCSGTSFADDAEPATVTTSAPTATDVVDGTEPPPEVTGAPEVIDADDGVPAPELVELIAEGVDAGGVDPSALAGFDVDLDTATLWGHVDLYGRFRTAEVSGCWVDEATLFLEIDVYSVDGVLIGIRSPERGGNAALTHEPGDRCAGSDQGQVVTDDESIDVRLVGYRDTEENRYGFLLAPSDDTTYLLASGGSIGTLSYLRTYLPSLQAPAIGAATAVYVDAPTVDGNGHVLFQGERPGASSTTTGVLTMGFRGPNDDLTDTLFTITDSTFARE